MKLKKEQKTQQRIYAMDSPEFNNTCKFLESREPLSEEVKTVFILSGGEPVQSQIYDTIIYGMLNKDVVTEEDIIDTAGRLYYYMRELNKKLGRTCYEKDVRDATLTFYLSCEINKRYPELNVVYSEKWSEAVFACYQKKYKIMMQRVTTVADVIALISYYVQHKPEKTLAELLVELKEKAGDSAKADDVLEYQVLRDSFFERNKNHVKNNLVKSQITSISGLKKNIGLFSHELAEPKTKDWLYIVCIALSVSTKDFEKLRAAAARRIGDTSVFMDNELSNRDVKIQAVIRDIDYWYEIVHKETKTVREALPARVLERVDKMLLENGLETLYESKKVAQRNPNGIPEENLDESSKKE